LGFFDNNMENTTLRIIDANLNRTAEGLRVLEDIARLGLNKREISSRLKTIRHRMVQTSPELQRQLVWSRDATTDVGQDTKVAGEVESKKLQDILIANARRVQESLRVLEELVKTKGIPEELNTDNYRQSRFELYTIEQEMMAQLTRQDKLRKLAGLYVIIDGQQLKGRSHKEITTQAIRGGAETIQLREKKLGKKDLLILAREIREICREHGVLFFINDYLEVALDCEADGLHVGQEDLPAAMARKLLRPDQLLGCSANTVEQAQAAEVEGADHIGVGAIYATGSKSDVEVVGLSRLREIKQAVTLPVVAIGGINKDNAGEVMRAGASAIAVISAVSGSDNPELAAREIVKAIKEKK
jgi:thiamine-phosphate pyrophosphorylase